jgi:DNA-binding NarL/FixJ family response regulator
MATLPENNILKILTVDDSSKIAQHVGNVLKEIAYVELLGHAYKLEEAYKIISTSTPHIIFLDIQMQDESGLDVLVHLKERNLDTVVVMLSNLAYLPYQKKCFELGAKYFLDKSTDFEKIPETIELIRMELFGK